MKEKPPPPQTHTLEINNQNKGIEDILDIDSHCHHLPNHLPVNEGELFNISPPKNNLMLNYMLKITYNAKWNEKEKQWHGAEKKFLQFFFFNI